MDLTSTSSLVLFPTNPTHENKEQYRELARQASWQLPQQQQQQYQQQRCQLPSERVAAMVAQPSVQARRRWEREEMKRVQITSFRGKDGLLSPPPLPTYVRRKKKSVVGLNPRAMNSSPELSSASDSSDSESTSSPWTPPYSSRPYAASATNLSIYTAQTDAVGLGIAGPKSAPITRSVNSSPRMPSPFRNNTMDDALLGAGMIQPPSPSLLRPKSFWKNHPRSALASLAWSPCSQVVRRSTFVAAGMNIDQGLWGGNYNDYDPSSPESLLKNTNDKDDKDSDSDSETEATRQYEAVRAFGRSLWNASTLALAVESRNKVVGIPGVVSLPGDF